MYLSWYSWTGLEGRDGFRLCRCFWALETQYTFALVLHSIHQPQEVWEIFDLGVKELAARVTEETFVSLFLG